MRKKSLDCYRIHKGSNAQVMLNETFDAHNNLTHLQLVANICKSLEIPWKPPAMLIKCLTYVVWEGK